MPKVEDKWYGVTPSERDKASRDAEDIADRVNSPAHFTKDRGECLDEYPAYDGKMYQRGQAHTPFTAIKQPGTPKSSKRHSI